MKIPASKFLSEFRLDKSLRATALEEIVCSGLGGGIGATSGGIRNDGRVDLHHGSSTTFSIREGQACDDNRLLALLMARLAEDIQENAGEIVAIDGSNVNEFSIEYTEGELKGRIQISLSRRGKHYYLKAAADESTA